MQDKSVSVSEAMLPAVPTKSRSFSIKGAISHFTVQKWGRFKIRKTSELWNSVGSFQPRGSVRLLAAFHLFRGYHWLLLSRATLLQKQTDGHTWGQAQSHAQWCSTDLYFTGQRSPQTHGGHGLWEIFLPSSLSRVRCVQHENCRP